MTSYGNSKKVDGGKSAIKAAVIGMAIIFLSYSIVQLVWQAFITDKEFRTEFGCKEYSLPVRDPQKNLPVAEDQAVQDSNNQAKPEEDFDLSKTPRDIDDEEPIFDPKENDDSDVPQAVVVPLD